MIKIRSVITYRGFDPDDPAKGFWPALKTAMVMAGREWLERFLPRHFEPRGATLYGYIPRTRGYMIRKAKIKGHQKPLAWSGWTEAMARHGARVTASRRSGTTTMTARVSLEVPAYVARASGRAGMPDLADELVRTTQDELEHLAATVDRWLQALLPREEAAITAVEREAA